MKQGLALIWCRFWKRENSMTWSTSLGNIFWFFFIYKVMYIINESWKYLVSTQIQQCIPPWNKFLHITKAMFFIYFFPFFHCIWHPFLPPYCWIAEGIAGLPLLRKLLAICQKFQEPSFQEVISYLFQWLLPCLNFTLDSENLSFWHKQ